MYRQNPTPVGKSGYDGTAAHSSARTIGSVSRSEGHLLFSQKRGSEQISALLENGVMVPIKASDCAQRASLSSQPRVTIVSELSRTTSAPSRAKPMPRLAVSVKPTLSRLDTQCTCANARD